MYNLTEPAELVSNIVYMIPFYCMHYIDTSFQDEIDAQSNLWYCTFSFSSIIHLHFATSHIDFCRYCVSGKLPNNRLQSINRSAKLTINRARKF